MPPRRDTRAALIQVGVDLLRRMDTVTLIKAIGTREIARVAGVSSSTFFHHFGSLETYVEALVDALYPLERADLVIFKDALEEYAKAALPAETGDVMFQGAVSLVAADPNLRLRVGLWALGGGTLDERYGAFMDAADDMMRASVEAVLRAWGREARPPLDAQFVAAMFSMMNTGAALRYHSGSTALDLPRYAQAAMAMTMGLIRLHGDRRTMADRIAELNYYPDDSRRPPRRSRGHETRARIIDTAGFLFGQHGYEATSIAMIARNAEVSDATVYEHFRSKAGVAIALLECQADAVLGEPPKTDDPADDVVTSLAMLADFVAARSDHSRPFVEGVLFGDGSVAADSPIREFALGPITRATEVGLLRNTRHAADLVDFALVTAMARVIAAPSEGARAAADWAYSAVSA